MEVLNKSCLQVPKPQTMQRIYGKARPHINCSVKLVSWVLNEEKEIDERFKKREGIRKNALVAPDIPQEPLAKRIK